MTDEEATTLFDAHDELLRAWLASTLTFDEFAAGYGDFPRVLAGGGRSTNANPSLPPLLRPRLEFHRQVAGTLAGLGTPPASLAVPGDEAGAFLRRAAVMRLRSLCARYARLEIPSGTSAYR